MKKVEKQSDKMKWYDFYVYIRFPLSFVFGFFGLLDNINALFSIPEYIDNSIKDIIISFSLLQVSRYILNIFTYRQMKNYSGYMMNNVVLVLELISTIFYAVIQNLENNVGYSKSAYYLSSIIFGLFWASLNFIYFYKRYDKTKMAFDSPASAKKHNHTENIDNLDLTSSETQEELICKKCGAELNQNSKFCSSCGKKIKTKKPNSPKNFNKNILISVCSVLLIGIAISVTFNIIQYNDNCKLNSKTAEAEETLKEKTKLADYYKERFQFYFNECNNYQSEIYDLEDKSDFMDDYIEIVGVDEYYYHKYGCEYLDDNSFWAFNSEAAKSKGYHKCPHCH